MLTSKRQYGLDIIKIVAAMLVIAVHHFYAIDFYNVPYNGGLTMYLSTAIYLISLSCVPLFLIASGYLLRKRRFTKNHYKKIIYFFIEVFIIYFWVFAFKSIDAQEFKLSGVLRETSLKFFSPSYYVGMYFSLYLAAPFLNTFFDSLKDDQKKWFLLVMILTISLPKPINNILGITFLDTRPTAIWSVLYYFIGLYIRHFEPEIKKSINLVLMILTMASYSVILNVMLKGDVFGHVLGYYENIFTVTVSTLIFIFWYKVEVKNQLLKKIIPILSSMTLTFHLSSSYSDAKAMTHLTLTNTLRYDLPTIVPKVFLSMIYALPIGIIVYFSLREIQKRTIHLL